MNVKDETRALREASFGWKIQQLARRMDDRMTAELAELGLNLPQFPVIMTVLEHGGVTQVEIAKLYDRPAYVISRALDGLEEQGLVERRPHPTSRRAHEIHATQAGMALSARLHAIVEEVNAATLAPLSTAEREALLVMLPKLLAP
ncbi:MarR family transcriptional regulator [Tropicimonas sp. TH_r6]|uniref:MarR family winged helix-turn-helix transcriptional regulator n=1 Tax=Tropicimonas sp. TH_r6 TaxID=3082085 RepID=UPI00295411E4|nr:MarR family transcriptional regulator [Tropicimonas sp. TH_r6]MDV7142674.1 MarR family transcriptional regulator [Tropicimonas sp. TH_r6]